MHEIADGLDALPAGRRLPEQVPCRLRQQVGFAVPAPEQKQQGLFGERLHWPLLEPGQYRVGSAAVGYDSIAAQSELSSGCHDAAAPVSEGIPIGRDRNGRTEHEVVGLDDVRHAAVVDTQRDDHRCRLWALVDQLVADVNLHGGSSLPCVCLRPIRNMGASHREDTGAKVTPEARGDYVRSPTRPTRPSGARRHLALVPQSTRRRRPRVNALRVRP